MGFDQIADALGNQARRHILVELLEHNPLKPSEAMATHGTRENDELEVLLLHSHLPKLDALDYILWDMENGTITKGANWGEIEPVVRLLSENRERTPPDTF